MRHRQWMSYDAVLKRQRQAKHHHFMKDVSPVEGQTRLEQSQLETSHRRRLSFNFRRDKDRHHDNKDSHQGPGLLDRPDLPASDWANSSAVQLLSRHSERSRPLQHDLEVEAVSCHEVEAECFLV
jgi:hypothetical protein